MQLSQVETELESAGSSGPASLPIEELRHHRADLQATEAQISFVRRMVQVRMDLLVAARSDDADEIEGRRVDVLLAALPDLTMPRLSSTASRRPPSQRAMVHPDEELLAEAEHVTGADLAALIGRSSAEVEETLSRMTDYEDRLSVARRRLHILIDEIQSEIARRYSSGELTLGS